MRFGLITIFATLLLSSVVGCAGEQREVIDPSTDPAWIPPGQGDLAVADTPPERMPKPKAKPRARSLQQPNRREMEALRLHAAN